MPFMTTPERIGQSRGLHRGIEVFLRHKFGEAALELMTEIRQILDVEKLDAVLEAIETAATPEELRRLWAP